MKKYLSLVFLLMLIFLASCSSKDTDISTRAKDSVGESVIAEYKISLDNFHSLKEVDPTDSSYYDIKVPNNASDLLFVYQYDVTDLVTKHANKLRLKERMLSFNPLIYTEEYNYVVSTLSDSVDFETVLSELGEDFALPNTKTSYKGIKAEAAVKSQKDNSTTFFTMVYMPVYVERVYKTNKVLQSYMFIPVLASYTTNNSGDTYNLIKTSGDSYTLKTVTLPYTQKQIKVTGTILDNGMSVAEETPSGSDIAPTTSSLA